MNGVDHRWRFERAGIINLFEYADEEFAFDGGRLILKGPNGSGKSKALELLFPFLFEGDMAPTKLDPFGKRSRTMKWNLLMEKHDFRVGYAWATVTHDDPEHNPQCVSFGACLEAHKDWPEVRSRFFVIEDKRPGVDFDLIGSDDRPLRKEKLTELIRSLGGEDFTEAHLYRARLNDKLFGFQTPERMQQWIRLLRVLRRPQLSDDLNEEKLNDLLSAALPEIDSEHLESASRRLDQIDGSRRHHETLEKNTAAVNDFGAIYGRYARAELRERAEQLQSTLRSLDSATADLDDAESELAKAQTREAQITGELKQLESNKNRLAASRDELNRSPEMRTAREIQQTREALADLGRQLQRRRDELSDARDELKRTERRLRNQQESFDKATAELERLTAQTATVAAAAGIGEHEALVAGLDGDGAVDLLVQQILRFAADRTKAIARARELRQQKESLDRVARQRAAERAITDERLDDRRSERSELGESLEAARDALSASLERWLGELQQLNLDQELRDRLCELSSTSGAPDTPTLAELTAPAYLSAIAAFERRRAVLLARIDLISNERSPLHADIAALEAEADPEPTPMRTRTRGAGRPGAPLWRLIDWCSTTSEEVKAGVEGALEASGVLDAWVLPDGTLLDLADDVELVPRPIGGQTLAAVLEPVRAELDVPEERVGEILASIGCEQPDASLNVSGDGSFAFGPVRGHYRKTRAEFIGATARAETRRKRLEIVRAEVVALDEQIRACERETDEIAAQQVDTEREFRSLPDEHTSRKAFADLAHAQRQEEAARVALDEATKRSSDADREADLAGGDLELHCDRLALPAEADPAKLEECERQVAAYVEAANDLRLVDKERVAALALVEDRSEDAAACDKRAGAVADACAELEGTVDAVRGRLDALAVASEGAEQALARLGELDAELAALQDRETQLRAAKDEAVRQTGSLNMKADGGREQVKSATRSVRHALDTVRAFAAAEMLPLALERAATLPGTEEGRVWDASQWRSFFASLPANVLQSRGGRDHLLNELDQGYEILRQEIDATQLQLSRERVGDLYIVKPRMGGEEHSFASLVAELSSQVAESEQRLSEQDRELFEDFVTGGLVEHLRVRIAEAHLSVQRMKEEISRVEASSGMSIGINWRRRNEDSPVLKQALELLQHSPAKLSDDDRKALSSFIREQIAEARLGAEENETTARQLEHALDYRSWHRFVITKSNRRRGIDEHEMTKRAHETGSGGEKAIALHLPLLAAAASYPTSARADALRLVILDEAFTRIDDEGRRGLMAMMVAFDLDIVLTSPDFWGCYREVPGLSIYQLAPQDPDHPGVVAKHFVWNGQTRREVNDDDLSRAA